MLSFSLKVTGKFMRAVSYLAPNMLSLFTAVCHVLGETLGEKITLVQSECDSLDDTALHEGKIDLTFICGLPLMRLQSDYAGLLSPLTAPVFEAERYHDQPLYFADFIVRRDNGFYQLSDLAGKRFGYNDAGSNSGYHLPRYHLYKNGYPDKFFGQLNATGAHQNSIQEVAAGKVDAAAIDSTVLEQELRQFPELAQHIRIIDSTSPCPVPPIALSARLEGEKRRLREALLSPTPALKEAMAKTGIHRYAPVDMEDYAVIASMFLEVENAGYQLA
jgi:phosphonate transport system substrate-binding protein